MTIIYFILILGITVFIHELGHFLFAKKAGIYCYEFSLGMGPRIFKFNRKNDETDYSIRLFPIGGFVQMAGEEVEADEDIPKEKRMQSKTWFQRFMTMVAGVLFNFIFAIIILFIVGLVTGTPVTNKAVIVEVSESSPAATAGLESGMTITRINGVKTHSSDRFLIEYQVNYGEALELEVVKDGVTKVLTISPEEIDNEGETSYRYGFALDGRVEKSFLGALKYAFTKFASLIEQMVIIIAYLFTGNLSLNSLSGPIGIFTIVGESAKLGFINVVYLLGYISLNVGFINLLPIPAFDGGRILFLIIEGIRRNPLKPEIENRIHTVGFVLLMILMVVITYNDIMRFIIK